MVYHEKKTANYHLQHLQTINSIKQLTGSFQVLAAESRIRHNRDLALGSFLTPGDRGIVVKNSIAESRNRLHLVQKAAFTVCGINKIKNAVTKNKARSVLNMIFNQALDDGLIEKSPMSSHSLRIKGKSSTATKPYSVEEMQFLVSHINDITGEQDRAYIALAALHPLRPEEVLGLQWRDIDFHEQIIWINRAVTHPSRNRGLVGEPKTEASRRVIALVPQIIPYLKRGADEDFVLGGSAPLSYTQVRRMCDRIQHEIHFPERILPRRFRTTVLTDIYDMTKDIKSAQAAAGHTTAAMTLRYYVKGREKLQNTAASIAKAYGLQNEV